MCNNPNHPDFDETDESLFCRCRRAALNGYSSMIRSGAAETEALEAAIKVYRFYHPADSKAVSSLTVERWLHAGRLH